jgi:hypothetical protein
MATLTTDKLKGKSGRLQLGTGVIGFSVFWCVAEIAYAAHRSPSMQLPAFLLFPTICVAAVFAVVRAVDQWRYARCRALVLLLCCPMAVAVWWYTTPVARRAVVAWSFPSYEAIVRRMEAGTLPVPNSLAEVPEAQAVSRMTHAVRARRAAGGPLVVEFHTEGGFPVLHSGYLYCSDCATIGDARHEVAWPVREQVKQHWFWFSN